MRSGVTQKPGKTDGEGEAAIGVATSPLRSGRRLGSVSEEFPADSLCRSNVRGSSFLLGGVSPEVDVFASVFNSGSPLAVGLQVHALETMRRVGLDASVPDALHVGCATHIDRPVIPVVSVDMIDDHRDIAELNTVVERIDNPVDEVKLAAEMDLQSLCLNDAGAGFLAGKPCVNGPRYLSASEVTNRSHLPNETSFVFIENEAFPEVFEADVFNDQFVAHRSLPTVFVFSQRPAARFAADETSPIEGFEHIGEVSVRLVSEWSRPRMTLARNQEG